MTDKQKHALYRIIISAVLLIVFALMGLNGILKFALFLIPYLIVGLPVLKKAAVNISHGQELSDVSGHNRSSVYR